MKIRTIVRMVQMRDAVGRDARPPNGGRGLPRGAGWAPEGEPASTNKPAGITLTEILIAIMILGVGLVSLATLFPIGLLRLREAQRQTRSAYLFESATADVAARGLLNANSFVYADLLNSQFNFAPWYFSLNRNASYDPLVQDTPAYGADPYLPGGPPWLPAGASSPASGGYGLPFAYDPLWRYQTNYPAGVYLFDTTAPNNNYPGGMAPEARFGDGTGFLRQEADGFPASAHGLQRLTNFNRGAIPGVRPAVMPAADVAIRSTFVSPEDVVWQESGNSGYTLAWNPTVPVGAPSPVVPDLSISRDVNNNANYMPVSDWRFSWMLTAQQNNSSNGAAFEGNIVVFENRPFSLDPAPTAPGVFQVAAEPVYEGVFGFSTNVQPPAGPGYGAGADRTVLIRWFATQPDPIIKVGDWIADVTYERTQALVGTRFPGVPNPLNQAEWDNLPAQRCFWYQVQKVGQAGPDQNPNIGGPYRSMVVYVNRKLDARTLLQADGFGTPVVQNAVLVSPYVVNVIPQTFFVR
jgi:type II secretory pathway pseudopilin PulG